MAQTKEKLNMFLKDLSYGMVYEVLEEGKNSDELEKVAKRHKLKLPAKDLAVFKGIYAFVNQENANGCTLPKDEVEKALDTLNGKSVDFDHLRKKIVGYWLEGSLEKNDQIIAYGVFFKGSLQDEYEELKTLLSEGKLKISFEAWGTREENGEGDDSYDLKNIEFAGGALLITTQPAFAGAKVLEMAKSMSEPKGFFRDSKEFQLEKANEEKFLEFSRFYTSDMETISRLLWEVACPTCNESYLQQIDMIDFENSQLTTTCYGCNSKNNITLTPRVKKMETARKIESISKKSDSKEVLNISEDEKIMEEKVKQLEEAIAKLNEKIAGLEAEKASLTAKVADAEKSVEEANARVESAKEEAKKELEEATKLAAEKATKVAERKAELGEEFAKDMSDEDILNEDKFELAKVKKENALLKANKVEKANTTLTAGAKNEAKPDKIAEKQKNVRKYAFGDNE